MHPAIQTTLTLLALLFAGTAAQAQSLGPSGEGFGWAVAARGAYAIVGEPLGSFSPGTVSIYRRDDITDAWEEQARLQASDGVIGDGFGSAVALGDDRAIVGAPDREEDRGAAYIFRREGEVWIEEAILVGRDPDAGHTFGAGVAISGDMALVGASGEDIAYVYQRDAGTGEWEEQAVLTGSLVAAGDLYGWAVALQEDEAWVGAQYSETRTGAVYVYTRDAGTGEWTEQTRLTASNAAPGARFGRSLALDENRAVVGAPLSSNTGAAYVFSRAEAGDPWKEEALLAGSDLASLDLFGWSTGVSGDVVTVGAPGFGDNEGAVYMFRYDAFTDAWLEQARLEDTEGIPRERQGTAVAIDGAYALAGAPRLGFGTGRARPYHFDDTETWVERPRLVGTGNPPFTGTEVPCAGGTALVFSCEQVELLSLLPPESLGAGAGVRINDLWGWTDPDTGREYALVGREDGSAFVDVTDPVNPVYLGNLPRTAGSAITSWRDIKVYADHAFIVSDNSGNHGMQVFDLTQLRAVADPPALFTEAAHYDGFEEAHNIAINEDTGYAYAVGTETCGGGLHMIDIQDPLNPVFAGCFAHDGTGRSGTGYTHDVQCVLYHGPDAEHVGREICFGSNENAVSIADVTDKQNPFALSSATYPGASYIHQGWLTEDHRYFLQDDELDETSSNPFTHTFVWDVSDLDEPVLLTVYTAGVTSTDHNLYVRGHYTYEANYTSGLRILDIADIANPVEVAYFDTHPVKDLARNFDGAWSVYPFFPSGTLAVSSRAEGLFLLRPTGFIVANERREVPDEAGLLSVYPNPFRTTATLDLTLASAQYVRVGVYDLLGRLVATLHDGLLPAGLHPLTFDGTGRPAGLYLIRVEGEHLQATRTVLLVR